MRRILILLTLAITLVGSSPAVAKVIHLKLAVPTGTAHPFYNAAVLLKKAVEQDSHGQLLIQIYPNRMLGGDKEIVEGTRDGSIDMGITSSIMMPLALKKQAFYALQLPFLVKTYSMEARMLNSPAAEKMLASLQDDGLKGLALYEGGLRHFLSTKGLVKTISDFKGLKTRIVPVPLFKQMWQAVGTNPVGIAYGEVYTSLQTHVIDAVETNISSIESDHYYEAAKYLTLTGHYFWPGVMLINLARFNALPKDLQDALVKAARETSKPQIMDAQKNEEELETKLRGQGLEISKFEDLDKMDALMKPILENWSNKDPLIRQYVDEARQ